MLPPFIRQRSAWCYCFFLLIIAALGIYLLKLRTDLHALQFGFANAESLQRVSAAAYAKRHNPLYTSIEEVSLATAPDKLIQLSSRSDIAKRRQEVIELIWGTPPALAEHRQPAVVEKDVKQFPFPPMAALERVDRLTIRMEYGIESMAYLLHPKNPGKRLVLFHGGHEANVGSAQVLLEPLLARHYYVLVIPMLLQSPNPEPVVDLPRFGMIRLTQHNQVFLLERPLHFFFEPIVEALNYVQAHLPVTRIDMTGLGGGGWTTTLYAAMDPRVVGSYPVAGSLPHYLLEAPHKDLWNEQEVVYPPLYKRATYLELYVMAAHGENRRHIQILNQFDSCCFAGVGYHTYLPAVQKAVRDLGPGHFEVFSDNSLFLHAISPRAVELILKELDNGR